MKEIECETYKQPHCYCMSRLKFESQRTRLNTQIEYEQEQLHKLHKLINKMEETIKEEEAVILTLKKVLILLSNVCSSLSGVLFLTIYKDKH